MRIFTFICLLTEPGGKWRFRQRRPVTVIEVCLERKIVWVWSGHNTVCLVRPVSHCVAIRTLSQCILSTIECCDSCQSHHHRHHLPPMGSYKHLKIKCDLIETCHRWLHQLPQPIVPFSAWFARKTWREYQRDLRRSNQDVKHRDILLITRKGCHWRGPEIRITTEQEDSCLD